jgi:hypothetical protein
MQESASLHIPLSGPDFVSVTYMGKMSVTRTPVRKVRALALGVIAPRGIESWASQAL